MSAKSFTLAAALAALTLSPVVSPLSAATFPSFEYAEPDADLQNSTAEAPNDTPLGSGRVVVVPNVMYKTLVALLRTPVLGDLMLKVASGTRI